jgi:polysaccharide export outer membrane protein
MRFALIAASMLALAACSALPHDGPNGGMVKQGAAKSAPKYALVDLDYRTTQLIAAQPPAPFESLAPASSDSPVDLIAAGDALAVSVFEAGQGGLFARPAEVAGGATPQSFPKIVVDARGMLSIPFAGDVRVAGLTPKDASDKIRQALRGRAVDPQVTVTVVESPANSVAILGEVKTAGRIPLAPNSDRLLDVIALAGGATKPPYDVEVLVTRGDRTAHTPYSELLRNAQDNIRLAPHDRVELLYKARKYSTFGALDHNAQLPIEDESVTLAGAISRAGGLDFYTGDGGAVLVFRFERPAVAAALGVAQPPSPQGVPIIYKVNLRSPEGYLVANSFQIQADDMVYVPRAGVAEARQFLELVNLVSSTSYNVRVSTWTP